MTRGLGNRFGGEGSSVNRFDTLRGRVRWGNRYPEVSLRSPPANRYDPAGVTPATLAQNVLAERREPSGVGVENALTDRRARAGLLKVRG